MWSEAGLRYFRRAVKFTLRSSCFTCFTLKWNDKDGRAEPCRKNACQFRNFQIYTGIMTLLVVPIFFARTYQLLTSAQPGESRDLKVFLVTFLVTDLVFICTPYLWFLAKPTSPQKLVMCYETALLVDSQIQSRWYIREACT